MPEYPDITIYLEALERKIGGEVLEGALLKSPFLLRSVEPKLDACFGKRVLGFTRLGKRIAIGLEDELHLVFHLMIAGRFQWSDKKDAKPPGRNGLAAFSFSSGALLMTEASKKKRASLHVVRGAEGLTAHEPGGVLVFDLDEDEFKARLVRGNHTLKRALTDPRVFSGIGNAYSDEILHRAQLSPVKLTQKLDDDEIARLYVATKDILLAFTERMREEIGDGWPKKVTAFRDDMAVHGRYKEPCPVCETNVQRIVRGDNETNYCPRCQTGGKLLADRSLSRLLKKDWPKTIEELESLRGRDA
jgi:formamidopyrimidine-DNA glycosylase